MSSSVSHQESTLDVNQIISGIQAVLQSENGSQEQLVEKISQLFTANIKLLTDEIETAKNENSELLTNLEELTGQVQALEGKLNEKWNNSASRSASQANSPYRPPATPTPLLKNLQQTSARIDNPQGTLGTPLKSIDAQVSTPSTPHSVQNRLSKLSQANLKSPQAAALAGALRNLENRLEEQLEITNRLTAKIQGICTALRITFNDESNLTDLLTQIEEKIRPQQVRSSSNDDDDVESARHKICDESTPLLSHDNSSDILTVNGNRPRVENVPKTTSSRILLLWTALMVLGVGGVVLGFALKARR